MSKGNIFLIGFMGVGKSTVAAELKTRLQMELIEMDETIEKEQGMAIARMFEQYGEEHFRDIESAFVEGLLNSDGKVISCGGGAVLRQRNADAMKKSGKIVLLTAAPKTIYGRVKGSTSRPILNGNMNVEYISGLMEKRRPRYEEVADIIVETDGKSAAAICEEIAGRLAGEN